MILKEEPKLNMFTTLQINWTIIFLAFILATMWGNLLLFGRTEVSSGELWWQSNIDKGKKVYCGNWFSRSKFSFIPKCLNSFV